VKKPVILLLGLLIVMEGIFSRGHAEVKRVPDDKILIDSGIASWVPNPLVGSPKWKKFFSDEKFSSSKKVETTWYYDSKARIKGTTEKLNFKGQPMGLEGATLVWTKVVGLKPDEVRYLFYALWPEKRVALFFGIFEEEDGIKYVEDISEMEDIPKLPPGLAREILDGLFNAISKPWWKVW
jgi:hypothetical protein